MAVASSSSPAWSQRRLAGSAGQPLMAAALTGATCPAGPRAAVSSPRSRGGALGRADLPHGLGGYRRALAGQVPGDLGDAEPAAAQGRHLVHAGGGVPEGVGDLRGGQLVDEVGAHGLVPALGGAGRVGEEACPCPHPHHLSASKLRSRSHCSAVMGEAWAWTRRDTSFSWETSGNLTGPHRAEPGSSSAAELRIFTNTKCTQYDRWMPQHP